jgi:hypothetical protein
MRVPLIRSRGDESPIEWWEWLFAPLLYAVLLLAVPPLVVVSLGAAFLYPDQHLSELDFGTPREQALAERYRRFTRRVPVWRRVWRVCTLQWQHRRRTRRCT